MNPVFEAIRDNGVIPALKVFSADEAVAAVKALMAGGFTAAEFVCREAVDAEAIKAVKAAFPAFTAGAGSIISKEGADLAVSAGADYISTLGYECSLVKYCSDKDVAVIPGIASVADMIRAYGLGIKVVKAYPICTLGGNDFIKMVMGSMPDMKLVCEGLTDDSAAGEYLRNMNVLGVTNFHIACPDLIKAGKFDEITKAAEKAIADAIDFKLFHVGINMPDEPSAQEVADKYIDLFHLGRREVPESIFGDFAVEIMKAPGRGAMGHIGFYGNSVNMAIHYLEQKGLTRVTPQTFNAYDRSPISYFNEEIGGFAVHVSQRA